LLAAGKLTPGRLVKQRPIPFDLKYKQTTSRVNYLSSKKEEKMTNNI
jgi:hypothetical protein